MDVFRYLIAVAVLLGLCGTLWRIARGRWRWFAAAVTFESAVGAVLLSAPRTIDSWGVVALALLSFLYGFIVAGVLIAPAIAAWGRGRGIGTAVSVLLVGLWLLLLAGNAVYPIWDRWGVCLPPGIELSDNLGEPYDCELPPL